MKIYVTEEAAHLERDLAALIAAAELGDRIEKRLLDPKDPFAMLLDRARSDFMVAVQILINADLESNDGIFEARRAQAQAVRYRDMCQWITDALEEAGGAVEAMAAEADEDPAVEQLKDQLNGNRAKPAPDA